MIDFIKSESKKLIYNCIERESKRFGIPLEKTRLALSLDENGNNAYSLIHETEEEGKKDFKTLKKMSFMDVLDVKIDFKGYSLIAPPFIQKSLIRFSHELSIEHTKVNAVCYPTYKKGEIAICIFNEKNYVKQIELSHLFSEQDAEIQ